MSHPTRLVSVLTLLLLGAGLLPGPAAPPVGPAPALAAAPGLEVEGGRA